ncbi:lysophospholipid acyltransferase family protein [Fertoebacter nigrum]|uniref:Lysophospholipid acyltransferase family protein n=1 Tax=Fertoeibacter niger TaxID=2656921 RepID=A0A8X8KNM4_9RHOB|nr:lysophospholipid acyltransferase family protein [Fertoeibacter niger]NUB45155.1 lysophospholipid acyltransferase family protein [Fertoeibacter niger]
MKSKLDPLIAERAPWLFSGRPRDDLARHLLTRLLGYPGTVALAERLETEPTAEIFRIMGERIAHDVQVTGLEHLPRNGPALIVANHPTGIADGIILHRALAALRPDLYFYANRDILRVLPQMEDVIAPVEWRAEKRSHTKTRETMEFTRAAIEAGRLGVIFPSGRLAKRTGLKLMERPWMASAAMIARKFDLPVIPVNIRARNSTLFYLFDLIHPTLRDITLFHEVLNKHRQPFRLTMGRAIPAERLPARSEDGIEMLRAATLALGGEHAPAVSLVQMTRLPRLGRAVVG